LSLHQQFAWNTFNATEIYYLMLTAGAKFLASKQQTAKTCQCQHFGVLVPHFGFHVFGKIFGELN